ncbi:MAG: TRAP transporter small permease subunit [Oxalobacteraceae bacterium]|nr:TRAP transporter small permease subunit [Oxalobacteraceae bacterium]
MKSAFLNWERRLTASSMWLACAMLVVSSALGIFQIAARFVFEIPAEWTEVLIRFSLIWMVFLGITGAFRIGAMVSIDLIHRMAPPVFRRVLEAAVAILTICLLLVIVWYGWDYAQRGKVQTMMGLESISMFWAYLALPVGSLCAIVSVIGNYLDPLHLELETAL